MQRNAKRVADRAGEGEGDKERGGAGVDVVAMGKDGASSAKGTRELNTTLETDMATDGADADTTAARGGVSEAAEQLLTRPSGDLVGEGDEYNDESDRAAENDLGKSAKDNASSPMPAPTPNLYTKLAPQRALLTNISTHVRYVDDSEDNNSGGDREEKSGDSVLSSGNGESSDGGDSSDSEESIDDGADGVSESERDKSKESSSDSDVEMLDVSEVRGQSILKGGVAAAIAAKPVQSEKTRRFFRARYPSYVPLVVYTDPQTKYTLHVFTDDSDSLLNNTTITGNAIDYFIYRYMENMPNIVCPVGTALFCQIELAYTARSPAKKKALIKSSMSMFNWSAYQYVLVPLCGRNHRSFSLWSARQAGSR